MKILVLESHSIDENQTQVEIVKDFFDKEAAEVFALRTKRFNPEKSNNPFAYFTQIAKNGFAKGWKKLHPPKNPKTIPFSYITGDDNSYNI
jgi:hypothetical protein